MSLEFVQNLIEPNETKIVLLVMDGLGGLPLEPRGDTALEAARTPNLDRLAAESICGLHQPVAPGITPGSGPSHLALFGYDPLEYEVGRGVLSALGIDFDLAPGDVAARGNYCTLGDDGRVADRRAGRIPTEKNRELSALLRNIELPGVEVFVRPVKEYRLLLVLRGEGLSGNLADTDPQDVGQKPLDPEPGSPEAEKTAGLVRQFLGQAREILAGHHPANMVLLRGFSQLPDWSSFERAFGLRAAAIAGYPMYRGVAKLVGMDVLETGAEPEEEWATLEQHWDDYDFFFLHVKRTDSAGEDGDFERKAALIEEVDALLPRLRRLGPDVLVVTGDHSTPAVMKYHSWHPVPVLLWSRYCRADRVDRFGERACMAGGLGPRIPAVDLMPLALANARRLEKFGA
jgi:2,3-bisphosphoglycerate-independent phosphoglycerate mutase